MSQITSILEETFSQSYDHEQDLFEQGMTSLSVLKLVDAVNTKLDVQIDLELFLELPTAKNLEALIKSHSSDEDSDTVGRIKHLSDKYISWITSNSSTSRYSLTIDLFEQGMTSLGIIKLVQAFQGENDVTIEIEDLLSSPTLSNLINLATNSTYDSDEIDENRNNESNTNELEIGKDPTNQTFGLLTTENEKISFLKKGLNIRSYPSDLTRIPGSRIEEDEFIARYLNRKSRRKFDNKAVKMSNLLNWLSVLSSRMDSEDRVQYLYPSAGGTYSVQVFIEVKNNSVTDLSAGIYYYQPDQNQLIKISNDNFSRDKHFYYNREHYDAGQFCVYLIANTDAIEPLYGKQTDLFVAIEAGCILQLLSSVQSKYNISGCALSGVNETALKDYLRLGKADKVLLSISCGHTTFNNTAHQPTSESTQLSNEPSSNINSRFPASINQLGLWTLQQSYPSASAYNCPALLKINSKIDIQAINSACINFILKHPVFKLHFIEDKGRVFQWFDEKQDFSVKVHDVSNFSENDIVAYSQKLAKKTFNLSADPLLRLDLLTKTDQSHWLLLNTNHIVCDGNSFYILLKDFFSYYMGCINKVDIDLIPDEPSYSTFISEEEVFINSKEGKRRLEYWKAKLEGIGLAEGLVPDKPRPAELSFSGATLTRKIDSKLSSNISNFISSSKITAPTLFLAAYSLLLRLHTGSEKVVIGLPTAGRGDEFQNHVGYFSNMVPLSIELKTDSKRTEFLHQIKSELIRSVSNSYPFTQLIQSLDIEASVSCYPVFCHSFVFQDLSAYGASTSLLKSLEPQLKIEQVSEVNQEGEYEIVLEVIQRESYFDINLKYNPDLYYPETIGRLLDQINVILEHLTSSMESSISEYLRLPKDDLNKILEWNQTNEDLGNLNVLHALFKNKASSQPNLPAVSLSDQSISYSELDELSDILAAKLQQNGVQRGDFVGLCMYRSLDMIVSLFAILKSGGAYVPIDPDFPQERIDFIINDCKSKIVTCHEETVGLIGETSTVVLNTTTWSSWKSDKSIKLIPVEVSEFDAAYVIYTSGSTGTPKGCLLEHRAVCNRIKWMQKEFLIDKNDSVLQKTPYSFDVSVWEFFWPLISGARLVLAKPNGHKLPAYLTQLIIDENISVCHFVPSMLNVFVESYDNSGPLNLRYLFTSGEALTNSQFKKSTKIIQGTVVNLYGPTEAAIDVTCWRAEERNDMKVPIGRPITNVQTHILDDSLNLVPIGVPGELYLGGDCLAREYINRPELTSEKFIDSPPHIINSSRLYKTGDLVRWLSDGNIEYLGRLDSQVKVRGFRIELGEIEHRLAAHNDVVDIVVKTVEFSGETQLAAYYTVRAGGTLTETELRSYLIERLPEYMVPSFFVLMDNIPLNSSGKADKKNLPDPRTFLKVAAYEPPKNELELRLAEIWKEILEIETVSRNQSFFDIGGSSLSVVTMLLAVKNEFPNGNISQVSFYSDPTIVGLSNSVLSPPSINSKYLHNLSATDPSESELTIICCPYAGASSSIYQSLSDQLCSTSKKVSVLSVVLPGNEIGSTIEDELSIVDVAESAAKEVLKLNASNIVVYGHCVGSFLAYELARRIEDNGLNIQYLAVGGSIPFPKIFTMLPISDPWRFVSEKRLINLIGEWGGDIENMNSEVRSFLTRNFRKDAKAAFLHQKYINRINRLEIPIISIFSKDDPLTKGYEKKYAMWSKYSNKVHLVTIETGKHYFVSENADQVSKILLQIEEDIDHYSESNHTLLEWPLKILCTQER